MTASAMDAGERGRIRFTHALHSVGSLEVSQQKVGHTEHSLECILYTAIILEVVVEHVPRGRAAP